MTTERPEPPSAEAVCATCEQTESDGPHKGPPYWHLGSDPVESWAHPFAPGQPEEAVPGAELQAHTAAIAQGYWEESDLEYRGFIAGFIAAVRAEPPQEEGGATLEAAAREIIAESPPEEWEPYDSWGDYVGYGEHGDAAYVEAVDQSNSGDVHAHGKAVRAQDIANRLRVALAPAPVAPGGG